MGATGSDESSRTPPKDGDNEAKKTKSVDLPASSTEAKNDADAPSKEDSGTDPTDDPVQPASQDSNTDKKDVTSSDKMKVDDSPSPVDQKDKADKDPSGTDAKPVVPKKRRSHDSPKDASVSQDQVQDPTNPTDKNETDDDKNETASTNNDNEDDKPNSSTMDDADAAAINAILWDAGLSKAEVSKRTKLNENGEVVELDLERCEQMTDLPSQIGKLSKLKTLNLSGCKEMKTLPAELGDLASLRELYLTNCHKLTQLPAELGKLVDLEELYLTNCLVLESLPPEIGQLANLQELYLTGCKQLKELPKEIGNLSNLTELKLFSCTELEEIPPEIGKLTKLTKLDLRLCDRLKELPPEIGKLSKLTTLNLTGCKQLVELPKQIGDLKKLTELILRDCKDLASLPPDIAQLSQLAELDLEGCDKLKKVVSELRESAARGGSRSPIDRRQSGLDIIGIAAAHLEKVPEKSKQKIAAASRSASQENVVVDLNLSDDFFKNVPEAPKPDEVITSVGENDVLCGRGGETNHHEGNKRYRSLVKQHQLVYLEAKRLDKPRIALKIVNMVRKNGGKFLKKHTESGTWRDVGNQKAREKTSQTLREGAPELRDPTVAQASSQKRPAPRPYIPPFDPQAMAGGMQIDPVWEQMMFQKRNAERMMMQQQQMSPPPRKKYKLPTQSKNDQEESKMMMLTDEGPENTTPSSERRGSRLQILKARQDSDSEIPEVASGNATGDPTVVAPTTMDVVYGKGKAIQDFQGNIRFRGVVDMHRQAYHAAFRRADKTQISKDIVQWIRSMGGRFLQLDSATGKYHDVGDEVARDKVSHALRSRKDASSRPSVPWGSPGPEGSFMSPEERAQNMANTMDIVNYLQSQDQEDVERTYYHKMQGEMMQGAPPYPAAAASRSPAAMKGGAKPGESASPKGPPKEGETGSGTPKKTGDVKKSTKDWPLKDVEEPHENDVIYGRGGRSNNHSGNKRFRMAVKSREFDYLRRKNKDKQLVAMEIVREWRNQDPPGRFLKKDEKTGLWHDVGDQKAREKTSQAFRENAPHAQQQSPPMQPPPPPHMAGRGAMPMGFGRRPGDGGGMDSTMMWHGPYPPPPNSRDPTREGNSGPPPPPPPMEPPMRESPRQIKPNEAEV